MGKSNAARPTLPGIFAPRLAPAEAAGNHQVDDQEELALELEDDPLAQAAQSDHAAPGTGFEWRIDGAHQERAGQPNPGQRLT